MDPQCHPRGSQAKSENDLQSEQTEFFLSGSSSCVQLINSGEENFGKKFVAEAALGEVIERKGAKPPQPPTIKSPLNPIKIKLNKSRINSTEPVEVEPVEHNVSVLKNEVSHENDEKLAKMSLKEIEKLRNEVFESVPESFLNKLRNKC